MRVELSWVDAMLSRWGCWALRRESGALGFASSSVLASSGDGDGFDSAIPHGVKDTDMEWIDNQVHMLPEILRVTVLHVYLIGQGKSDRKLAAALGIHPSTMARRVCEAHRIIGREHHG